MGKSLSLPNDFKCYNFDLHFIKNKVLSMENMSYWISVVSNGMTILTSGLALYLFFANRKKISAALEVVINYSNQLALTDLKLKIERLNEYNTSDVAQKEEVVNILHEIEGQIIGNKVLNDKLSSQLGKISGFTSNPRTLTEPKKRSLVSELRESIRGLDVGNFEKMVNSKQN